MFCARDWDNLDSEGQPVWRKHCYGPNCYYAGNTGRYHIDAIVFSDSTEDEIKRALGKIIEANPNDKKLQSEIDFTLLQSAVYSSQSYDEEVSRWTSYKDVAKWMARNYAWDFFKANKYEGQYIPGQPMPHPVKTPQQSFLEKNGLCFDAALFTKETLNRIDPSYEAEVIHIENRPFFKPNHVVCSFKLNGQMYIMDYGVPANTMRRGIFGPFASLDEYANLMGRIASLSGRPELQGL